MMNAPVLVTTPPATVTAAADAPVPRFREERLMTPLLITRPATPTPFAVREMAKLPRLAVPPLIRKFFAWSLLVSVMPFVPVVERFNVPPVLVNWLLAPRKLNGCEKVTVLLLLVMKAPELFPFRPRTKALVVLVMVSTPPSMSIMAPVGMEMPAELLTVMTPPVLTRNTPPLAVV